MTETLKAYACMEDNEYSGAVIFAKSNVEARRLSANEFNEGEFGGMIVNRAPWADKYGSRYEIPVSVMIDNGWHFECSWSGIRMDSGTFEDGAWVWDRETKEYFQDPFLIGKTPVGFQDGLVFACQEYADEYKKCKEIEKKYNDEQLEYFKSLLLKRLPDAIIIDKDENNRGPSITSYDMKTNGYLGEGPRYTVWVNIPFTFPGSKYHSSYEFREPAHSNIMGPTKPEFFCTRADVEAFEAWAKEQKEKYKID